MKLSDIRGEKALDVLADIMEPAVEIMADEEIANAVRGNEKLLFVAVKIIRGHRDAVIKLLAATDGVDTGDKKALAAYTDDLGVLDVPKKVLGLLNDRELMSLFTSRGQRTDSESSGSASENTEGQTG